MMEIHDDKKHMTTDTCRLTGMEDYYSQSEEEEKDWRWWNVEVRLLCPSCPRLQTTSGPFQQRSVYTVQGSVHSVGTFGSCCVFSGNFSDEVQRLCPCLPSQPLTNFLQFTHSILFWKLLLFSCFSCAWLPVVLSCSQKEEKEASWKVPAAVKPFVLV